MTNFVEVHTLPKCNTQVVLDADVFKASMTMKVWTLVNGVRHKGMGSAVFKKLTNGTWFTVVIEVEHKHRRKGIATIMYNFAEQHADGELRPSDDISDAARAVWAHRGQLVI